jgi:hypothetical protein
MDMASASIWNDNKVLKRWIKKYQSECVDGNFNYNLTDLVSDPLLEVISEKINVPKEYIYVGAGSSQLITVIVNLRIWNKVVIPLPELLNQNSIIFFLLYLTYIYCLQFSLYLHSSTSRS